MTSPNSGKTIWKCEKCGIMVSDFAHRCVTSPNSDEEFEYPEWMRIALKFLPPGWRERPKAEIEECLYTEMTIAKEVGIAYEKREQAKIDKLTEENKAMREMLIEVRSNLSVSSNSFHLGITKKIKECLQKIEEGKK